MEDSGTHPPVTNIQMDEPKVSMYTRMKKKIPFLLGNEGTAVAQWLRCCATNQKVWEMSTRSISWAYRQPVRKADNLTTILCRCHEIWET